MLHEGLQFSRISMGCAQVIASVRIVEARSAYSESVSIHASVKVASQD